MKSSKKGIIFVIVQGIIILAFMLIPVWTPGIPEWFFQKTFLFRSFVSGFLALASLLLGGSGFWNLRNYLTPLPEPVGHNELVLSGVYSLVRHPLYSSIMFAGASWTCFTCSLAHFLMLCMAFLFFSLKADYEECLLLQRHPGYAQYAEKVKKFIPWVF
ncbi:MAG: isoprenylcysteine carboxylmethyltransferase family protein [Chlorobiaceae bacterium]|nr:isoprenylcysteine carboxylmethyltransferase family protein [Chlorobiaceae bacterium]